MRTQSIAAARRRWAADKEGGEQDGEAKRDDENYAYVSAWQFKGEDAEPVLHKEELNFEYIELKQRSYK